ncbi:MAG: hypothetical protein IRZ04_10950 [Rhodospirillales bacterium]|nr:hypothetical protein [Rhodospirillales bacterium]
MPAPLAAPGVAFAGGFGAASASVSRGGRGFARGTGGADTAFGFSGIWPSSRFDTDGDAIGACFVEASLGRASSSLSPGGAERLSGAVAEASSPPPPAPEPAAPDVPGSAKSKVATTGKGASESQPIGKRNAASMSPWQNSEAAIERAAGCCRSVAAEPDERANRRSSSLIVDPAVGRSFLARFGR